MNHEHNPVAVRIGRLQEQWFQETEQHPDYVLARWLIHSDDADFLNGFLKLESSPHGELMDIFVVLFSSFFSSDTFAKAIIVDWIEMYKLGSDGHTPENSWHYQKYEQKLEALASTDTGTHLLLEMLQDFSTFATNDTQPLVVTFIPRSISNYQEYSDWVYNLIAENDIPAVIKFAIVDYAEHNYYSGLTAIDHKKTIEINPGNLDMRGALNQLASQGNQSDPQIQFRICMMKMGEATAKKNKQSLNEWGDKILMAAQRSGDRGMLASAHLIYGGFLMHFNVKEETEPMLQKALQVAKSAVTANPDHATILIQVYGYLGALESMNGGYKKALEYFVKQADSSVEHSLLTIALSSYKNIIYLCHTHGFEKEYEEYTEKGYQLGLVISDQELKVSDYSFIAYHYLGLNQHKNTEKGDVLDQRMQQLYGIDWKENLQNLFKDVATHQD